MLKILVRERQAVGAAVGHGRRVEHAGYLPQSQHEDDEPAGDPEGVGDAGVIFVRPGEHRDGGVGVRLRVKR